MAAQANTAPFPARYVSALPVAPASSSALLPAGITAIANPVRTALHAPARLIFDEYSASTYGAMNEPDIIPHEYDIISSMGVSVFATRYEQATNIRQRTLMTTVSFLSFIFRNNLFFIISMESTDEAVSEMDESVDTDAEMSSTSITPRRTEGSEARASIFGTR